MEQALKASDVLPMLNIKDRDTLYALVRSKRLRAVRLGREYRFTREAVEAFLRGEDIDRQPAPTPRPARPDVLKNVPRTFRR